MIDETVEQEAQEVIEETEEEAAEDEIIVTIGEETPPQEEEEEKKAPQWVKDLRKNHREAQKRIKELEEQLKPVPKVVEVGKKPTLEDCDYDADEFEDKLEQWHERKRDADKVVQETQRQEEAQKEAWNLSLSSYENKKAELKAKDFTEAEDVVTETLNKVQQSIIVQGADNPALVVYALGKNPSKAKELAEIKDPVKFTFALAKLEASLKMTTRGTPPPPEKTVTSSGRISGAIDNTLEKLRDEARRTGDYTKVTAYKQKNKGK